MANHPQRADVGPSGPPPWRLTDALNAKLAELTRMGLEVVWIEACVEDITRLVLEGGEAAIRLDPDMAQDRAWYGGVEIRHTAARPMTWVFVRGEVASGEASAHVVEPPQGFSASAA